MQSGARVGCALVRLTPNAHGRRAAWAVALVLGLVAASFLLGEGVRVEAQVVVVHTRAGEVSGPLVGSQVRALPFAARDVALHWAGSPGAQLRVAFSADGTAFGAERDVGRDEVGAERGNGETYGGVLFAGGAVAVRLTSDRPLGRVSVLALTDDRRTVVARHLPADAAGAAVPEPSILARSSWGADESLRFDSTGKEIWPPTFWPIQKLIVHHTATQNNDPDPAATIRSIYYYHAITQGWGDIGYNFIIDEAGHIYKGRHSHTTTTPSTASPSPDDTITGEDGAANGVTAAHAYNYNSGTVGVAFLGTLTNQDATPAAKNALEDLLAWKSDAHGIDPQGSALYTNPVNGTQSVFPNIAGHRDVAATECPGGTFYATLPTVRAAVANRVATSTTTSSTTTSTTSTTTTTATTTTSTTVPADTTPPSAPSALSASGGKRKIVLKWGPSTDTGGSGLAGYEIHRATSVNGTYSIIATTAGTSYTDGGVPRGRTYWYYIKAYDGAGNRSSPSNTASATVS
jgi:hypothetical protein